MKLNYKEIGLVSLQWNSTFEGILLCKHKVESRRKKGTVLSEHWCRLKGNILVLCRTPDRKCSEVEAVVFLERVTVSPVNDEEAPYAFQLEFDSGDAPIVFIARSGPEADVWCQHLRGAQLSPTLERIALIREELRNLTGSDPLDAGAISSQEVKQASAADEAMGSSDARGLELSLSCENLTSEFVNADEGPNVHIIVSVCTPPEPGWKRVGTTEVIENCTNPNFLKTVYLRSDMISENTRVQFSLMDLRDLKSSMGFHLGVVVTMVELLLSNPLVELAICDPINGKSLPCRTAGLSSGPRLCIRSRKHKPVDDVQAAGLVDTDLAALTSVCDNLLSKRYSFQHTLGEPMHVVEFMGESKLCFDFPIEYVKFLVQREHLLYDSLSRTGSSNPVLESFRKERLISMKQSLDQYEACLRHLVDCSGSRFKPSCDRYHTRLDFVPTNLHVNQIALTDWDGQIVSSHTIVSAGVFSVASRSYKSGGLFRHAANTAIGPLTYPPTRLSVQPIATQSPVASAACLVASTVAGQSNALLYRGTGAMAMLRADLMGLVQRLSAKDQAEPLAERIQKTFSSLQRIINEPMLLSRLNTSASGINSYFNTLLTLLTELSQWDRNEQSQKSAVSSPPPQPQKQPETKLPPQSSAGSGSGSVATPTGRGSILASIGKIGSRLVVCLDKMWDDASEVLWNTVFTELMALLKSDSGGGGGGGGYNVSSSPGTESNATASWLIGEAERQACSNPVLNVDNGLQAVSVIYDAFSYRHHACLCQALTTLLTALSVAVPQWNRSRWEQMTVCGLLAQFEGLISCFGNELGMIEDWAWAVERLGSVRVVLRPSGPSFEMVSDTGGSGSNTDQGFSPTAKMTGINECELTVPWSAWTGAPTEIQARGRVRLHIHPVIFLVGINEQQSIAEKFDKTALQQSVNNQGLASIEAYFERYTKHYGAPPQSVSNQDVCDLLASIRHLLVPPVRSKPVELLELASEITQAFGGLRFTSCKSAKDRTAMSITLEQIRWLQKSEGMHVNNFQPGLKCLRSTGLRLDNAMKNSGVRKYAFNRLQLLSFPKLYRPPVGTYAPGVMS